MIFIVVGKSCSGKTTARRYFQGKGYYGLEASDIVNMNKANYSVDSLHDLFNLLGKDFVAKDIVRKINNYKSKVVITGLRTPEEIEYIKSKLSCLVIGVYASDRICYERSLIRKREDNILGFLNFYSSKICSDYSIGLADVMNTYVDFFINNDNSNVHEFYNSLDKIVNIKREPAL